MGINKLIQRLGLTNLKIKLPFLEAEYNPNTDESQPKKRKKLFQLGYVYGQYCVTENEGRNDICQQIEHFWKTVTDNPPSEAVPKHLRVLPSPSLIGELATFLRRSLDESGFTEAERDLCLLGFMLFCQPLARSHETADLVIKYSQTILISADERKQLRSDCVATDLSTKDGAMTFFKKWTRLIEERL